MRITRLLTAILWLYGCCWYLCAQRAIVAPHMGPSPSVNSSATFPTSWYENWRRSIACGAFTGMCRHPWANIHGAGFASLVSAATGGMNGGTWAASGAHAVQAGPNIL